MNWEACSLHWGAGLLFKGPLSGSRNGLSGTSGKLPKENTKCQDGINPWNSTGQHWLARKQTGRKGPKAPVDSELPSITSDLHFWQRRTGASWAVLGGK